MSIDVDVDARDTAIGAYPYSVHWENEYGDREKAVHWANVNCGDYLNSYIDSWDLWGLASFSETSIESLRKTKLTRAYVDSLVYKIKPIAREYIKNKLDLY